MKCKKGYFRVVAGLALALSLSLVAPGLTAQQAPEKKPATKKTRKVWTNDDLERLRSSRRSLSVVGTAPAEPAPEKEKAAGAPPEAPKKKKAKAPEDRYAKLTPEERQAEIEFMEKDIRGAEEAIRGLRDQLSAAEDPEERNRLRGKIEKLEGDIAFTQQEIEKLRKLAQSQPAQKPPGS